MEDSSPPDFEAGRESAWEALSLKIVKFVWADLLLLGRSVKRNWRHLMQDSLPYYYALLYEPILPHLYFLRPTF